jgi:hypothetical protein
MRTAAAVAFWVVCFVVAANVTNRCGREWGLALVLLTLGAAWAGHTDRSRWMVGLLMEIAERHMPAKVAAGLCGVTASRWSEWRSGEEQASLSRLADLPDPVWNEWHKELLEGFGFVVVASGRLASATSAVLALEAAVRAHAAAAIVPRREVARTA